MRLAQGDFARVTDFGDDPVAIARRYQDAGATDLHLVSLDGARDGGDELVAIVRALSEHTSLAIQAAGGIRDRDMIARVSEAGAERVVLGSAAVSDVHGVSQWLDEYGSGALVIALDVRIGDDGVPCPMLNGWRDTGPTSLWHLLDVYCEHGLVHLLCTDVERDGMGTGPNLELYGEIMRRYPSVALQASGGVASLADVAALKALGASAVIVGRALLTGAFTPQQLMKECA